MCLCNGTFLFVSILIKIIHFSINLDKTLQHQSKSANTFGAYQVFTWEQTNGQVSGTACRPIKPIRIWWFKLLISIFCPVTHNGQQTNENLRAKLWRNLFCHKIHTFHNLQIFPIIYYELQEALFISLTLRLVSKHNHNIIQRRLERKAIVDSSR
jgi:hypothetical protein